MSQDTAFDVLNLLGYHQAAQAQFDYDGNNRVIYAGYAGKGFQTSDARWYIEKYTYTAAGMVATITTAPKNSIYDNRAGLVYS